MQNSMNDVRNEWSSTHITHNNCEWELKSEKNLHSLSLVYDVRVLMNIMNSLYQRCSIRTRVVMWFLLLSILPYLITLFRNLTYHYISINPWLISDMSVFHRLVYRLSTTPHSLQNLISHSSFFVRWFRTRHFKSEWTAVHLSVVKCNIKYDSVDSHAFVCIHCILITFGIYRCIGERARSHIWQ